MRSICPKCKHLMEENHECPSPEYVAKRDQLIEEAARAEEECSQEELEEQIPYGWAHL